MNDLFNFIFQFVVEDGKFYLNNLVTNVGSVISGQSYKASTIVNYDSRVVPDLKIPHINLRS